MKQRIGVLVLTFLLSNCASQLNYQSVNSSDKLFVEQLQQGGLVIFLRHAQTDHSIKDTDLVHLENCETQRNLSEAGKKQASVIGEAFSKLKIPVGEVKTSQFCRCIDTAMIAFGHAKPIKELTSIQGVTPQERQRRIINMQAMFSTKPADEKKNTVLVSHKWMFLDAAGQAVAEGEAAVLKPLGENRFVLLRRVQSTEWDTIVYSAAK